MKKKVYTITGITPEIAKKWNKDFREDITLLANEETGEVIAKVSLTRFQAFRVKLGMIKYNLKHPCVLKLNNFNGKRARV